MQSGFLTETKEDKKDEDTTIQIIFDEAYRGEEE